MRNNTDAKKLPTPTLALPRRSGSNRIMVQKSKLLVTSGPLQGKEFVIDKDVFTIGTDSHNDLTLQDSTVSRRHCEIQLTPQGYVIRDLGSTNGTIIQGVKVTEAFLAQSTEFQLGETKIVFCPLQEAMEYALSRRESFGAIIGRSLPMKRTFYLAETYASTNSTILIEGQTGTGKEILAQEIHHHSNRKGKPFIVIDCASLAKDLIASELFGHIKGAFTGANSARVGAFEHADGGTVFLDEIGDLTLDLQPKLLRVLEQKEIKRLGSNQVRNIDVRVVCASNRKLQNEVNSGRFREDLFFRLSVVQIELAPLRQRKEDIPLLAERFLKEFLGKDCMKHVVDFQKTTDAFANYDWPGNVRELRNLVELACFSKRRPIDLSTFLLPTRMAMQQKGTAQDYKVNLPFKLAKNELIQDFEVNYLRNLLATHDGNISRAARVAGIERSYLQRLIAKHKLK